MVMNTFRSKLRRRRNELFRKNSDEDNDEWQFVAFNPTVYPSPQPSGTISNKSNTVAALNGNYASLSPDHKLTPVPSHKASLRPWALKRASWHDGPPPVPPHGQGNTNKAQPRPLPPCPESSQAPAVPPHNNAPLYPGSVPNWYGSQFQSSYGYGYPQSVPSRQSRPTHLEGIIEHQAPVILRRDSSKRISGRPLSTGSVSSVVDSKIQKSPESVPPLVPPHGRPKVPQHFQKPSTSAITSQKQPQESVTSLPTAVGEAPGNLSPPPPSPPPHATELVTKNNLSLTLLNPLLSQPLPPSPPDDSSSSSPSSGSRVSPPAQAGDFPLVNSVIEGEKVGVGISTKEQRRSDPGGGGSGNQSGSSLTNHQIPSNGASGDDDQHLTNAPADDADHGHTDSHNYTSIDTPPNNFSKSQNSHKKRSGSNINRSESCKEKQHVRKQARENRKNSDPNIPTSKSGDVDGETPLSFHSGSSSNSSLSQSQESPPGNSAEQVEAYASALDNDSDIEADTTLPDWMNRLSQEIVETLTSKDRKRQDTINELFHTEQSHVRVLKVLQFLFHQPLRQCGYVSQELLDRLFPNLDQMLKFHTSFNKAMKKRRQESPLVISVGDILSIMFDGEEGAQFQQAAAEFVACQSFALESLKQQQKRDQKLAVFLQDQENHPHCRRLQLKDMLPAGFQRLSKYPLLLESLLSFTDKIKQADEYEQIAKALDRSKEILAYVNAAVQDAENHKRLREIQKKLDQSSMVKNKHANCEELRGELDLTKHNLIYEGPLTWKTSRGQKNIDLHVLILEDCVVLLQKDSDKYILKYHSMNKSLGKDDNKLNLSPIIKFGTFLCREVATDKCGIFIILTQSTLSAQIYELVTSSPMERSMWLRHLHDAQASYNAREGRNRRPQPTPHIPDSEESAPSTDLRDVEDGVDAENSESVEGGNEGSLSTRSKQDNIEGSFNSNSTGPQASSSPDSLAKKTELLRRKDLKIRQELEEKQTLIADILNIPHQDFESVADMAGEVGLSNQEPRELVLGAIYQAKKLQEALNEAQSIRDSDIIAAQACSDSVSKNSVPFCHTSLETMDKLNNITGTITQFLNSLMVLISERDDERERMRKELVASRERIHQLHMQQQTILQEKTTNSSSESQTLHGDSSQSTTHSSSSIITTNVVSTSIEPVITPHSSRPSSFVSANSSGAEQSELTDQQTTDEEGRSEDVSSADVQSQSLLSIERKEGESTLGEKTGTNSGSNSVVNSKEQQSEEAGST